MSKQQFLVETHFNQFTPRESSQVDAIIAVRNQPQVGAPKIRKVGIVFKLDRSGSMKDYQRMSMAIQATVKGITNLPEDAYFAVIAFDSQANYVYAPGDELVQATEANKASAIAAVKTITADGGTQMSKALKLARKLFKSFDGVPVGILLTDGENNDCDHAELEDELKACEGIFQCYPRGLGTNWSAKYLMNIAAKLMGEAKAICNVADVTADFRETIEMAIAKRLSSVTLRLWTPFNSKVNFVKLVSPTLVDITAKGKESPVGKLWRDYPLGAFGDNELREIHVGVQIPQEANASSMRVCQVKVAWTDADGAKEESGPSIVVNWSDDNSLTTRINKQVAHFTGAAELAENIQVGMEALKQQDFATASQRLGRAVQLAEQTGNADTLRLLKNVVVVEDAATGTVRLKPDAGKAAQMELETGSVRTARLQP